MLQCAAWTPWLLLALARALASQPLRNTILGGLAAGMMILAGHFQTILYSFLALALFGMAQIIVQPRRWLRILEITAAIPIIGTLLSAIATGPGLELAIHSVRAGLTALSHAEGMLSLTALVTLIDPDFYGVFSENYHGPQDITQYYLYAGIVLVPLAYFGLRERRVRWAGLLLIVPPIWYALGRFGGLFLLIARLPGFRSVRAPVNIWFVPALGFAILAAAGMVALAQQWRLRRLPAAVLAFACADLFYFQSLTNPLAYSRQSYDELYGSKEQLFHQAVASGIPPLTRFQAPEDLPTFGPMSHFFDQRTEVTYGYGPMPFSQYKQFVDAMAANPNLRKDLNVSRWLDRRHGAVRDLPDRLARANFPQELIPVPSAGESQRHLATLDPSRQALVPASAAVAAQDSHAVADVREFTPGHYRIHFRCASQSLLRVGNSYFPGWTANSGGRELQVVPVDHALLGVVVPAGEGDVTLDYHSRYFLPAALVTLVTLLACAGLLGWQRLARAS
jgi:hypothetical protein